MHSNVATDTTAVEPSTEVQEPFKPYKVWVELEEVNELGDQQDLIDLPGVSVAQFHDLQEATNFAIALQAYATTGRCDAISVAAEKIFELHEARAAMHDLLRELDTALKTGLHHSRSTSRRIVMRSCGYGFASSAATISAAVTEPARAGNGSKLVGGVFMAKCSPSPDAGRSVAWVHRSSSAIASASRVERRDIAASFWFQPDRSSRS